MVSPALLDPMQALIEDNLDDLYAYIALRVAPDANSAMDLVQEVMETALVASPSLRDPAAGRAWLFSIARSKVVDFFRRRPSEPLDEEPSDTSDEGGDERRERALRVSHCLRRLPSEQVELLEEKYVAGESVRAMAERRGVSEKAVESALARARHTFRREFDLLKIRQETA